jgi:CDP-paratose 2-epimerase
MKRVLVTGGAGFIGINSVERLIREGWSVTILDDLSRKGSEANVGWLKSTGAPFHLVKGDISSRDEVARCFADTKYDLILHLAAQVAVTTSVVDPMRDFEINALGTLNLLEEMRAKNPEAFLIYSSTNKVYGGMEHLGIVERGGRYEYADAPLGISEDALLDFHSPYGCSKGAADQYVRDYSRIYGLSTVSLRQSCIYGYRQFGVEDQGWVAWFTIAAELDRPITVYGDGKQTRDVLFIDDLVRAYLLAYQHRSSISGKVYNIGGGPTNLLSLLELLDALAKRKGKAIAFSKSDWRPGDQKTFVADIRRAQSDFDWSPQVSVTDGVDRLSKWVRENAALFT